MHIMVSGIWSREYDRTTSSAICIFGNFPLRVASNSRDSPHNEPWNYP